MNPAILGATAIGSSILGGITGAIGAGVTGEAQSQMNQYQAQVALINQQIETQNADYAREQGEQTAMQFGIQAGQQAGQIKAAQASSGFDVNTGSAKAVQQSFQTTTSMNLDQIRSNAAMTAYNFDVQATQYGNQATLYQMAGQNAVTAAGLGAVSSIVGGASSVSSNWMTASMYGMYTQNNSSIS